MGFDLGTYEREAVLLLSSPPPVSLWASGNQELRDSHMRPVVTLDTRGSNTSRFGGYTTYNNCVREWVAGVGEISRPCVNSFLDRHTVSKTINGSVTSLSGGVANDDESKKQKKKKKTTSKCQYLLLLTVNNSACFAWRWTERKRCRLPAPEL
jgi:hypothetical protein